LISTWKGNECTLCGFSRKTKVYFSKKGRLSVGKSVRPGPGSNVKKSGSRWGLGSGVMQDFRPDPQGDRKNDKRKKSKWV